jgi:hypothetical protein
MSIIYDNGIKIKKYFFYLIFKNIFLFLIKLVKFTVKFNG